VCTTTAEAMMSGLKTIEIHTDKSKELYSNDHLKLPDYSVRNEDDLIEIIKNMIFNGKRVHNAGINKYIKKYFNPYDKKNIIKSYASEIENFINDSSNYSTNSRLFMWYRIMLFFRNMRLKIINLVSKNRDIVKEVNRAPSGSKKYNKEKYFNFNGQLVHKDYGLFDNKIKPDDHQNWYQKFKKIGI
tara:strand:- start:235 stop:795 length:561 start_codon:yes stop_codon:yes gene_type:complete